MKATTSISLLGGIAVAALLTNLAPTARAEQITLHALMEDVPETIIPFAASSSLKPIFTS